MWERFRDNEHCNRCGREIVDVVVDLNRQVNRELVEGHHLIPRSEGGDKISGNIFLCAWNATRLFTGRCPRPDIGARNMAGRDQGAEAEPVSRHGCYMAAM